MARQEVNGNRIEITKIGRRKLKYKNGKVFGERVIYRYKDNDDSYLFFLNSRNMEEPLFLHDLITL